MRVWLDFICMGQDIEDMPDQNDFQHYFATELGQIEHALEQALPQGMPQVAALHAAMRYSVIPGGKRIRPLLVLCVTKMLCGNGLPALPAATALELLHCYTLIHDDLPCMDDDAVRRGMPTTHVKFGEATALLAGDALLTLAFEQAAQVACDPAPIVQLLAEAAGARGVIAGQCADLEAVVRRDVSSEDLTFIHTNKTAALFRAAATMGVYAAGKGADRDLVGCMAQFGLALGLAFQYVDDLLDAKTETAFSSVGVLGENTVRQFADNYTNDALTALAPFGEAAQPLRALTKFMLKREA